MQYHKDADSYFDVISFLKFQTLILSMLILILGLVLWSSKPNSIFLGKFESRKLNSLLCLEAGTQSILKMWL